MASIPDPRTVGPRTVGTRTRDAFLASNWWAAAVRAVVAIVIGSIAILAPMVTVLGLVMIFAAYALVDGVFAIVLAVRGARAHERWGWLAVNGIVSVAAAVGAMIYPAITALVFAVLLGAWAVVSGAATIVAGLELGRDHGRWWLIGGGVIAAAFGLFVLFMPPAGMLALSYLFGFEALFAGFTLLAVAFRLRSRHAEENASGDRTADSAARDPSGKPEMRHG